MAISIKVSVHSHDIAECELLRLARLIASELEAGYPSTAIPQIEKVAPPCGGGAAFDVVHRLEYIFPE